MLPTPALALHAMALGGAAIMVTGSHIPADRNGLKFYVPAGEISKADEAGILAALPEQAAGGAARPADAVALAGDRYRQRYRFMLGNDALAGWRIGVFEHSSVARDLLVSLLTRAGADVVRLARSETFVAVDTEAVSDPIYEPRLRWIAEHQLDAIVSTDGDGDRPLLIDGDGRVCARRCAGPADGAVCRCRPGGDAGDVELGDRGRGLVPAGDPHAGWLALCHRRHGDGGGAAGWAGGRVRGQWRGAAGERCGRCLAGC